MCQDNARKDKNLTFNTEVDFIVNLFCCATQKELLVFVEHQSVLAKNEKPWQGRNLSP